MSHRDDVDQVAELLNRILSRGKISMDEVDRAARRYNEIVGELNHSRHIIATQQQGQGHNQEESGEGKASKALEKHADDRKRLTEENMSLKRQVEELRTRLSSLASQRLTDGNPDIADLSDPYRPTNIAEKFKLLYDEDWTHAFEVLDQSLSLDESKIIDFLANIIKEVDKFCLKASQSQRNKIQHYIMDDFVSPKVELPDGKGTMVASKKASLDKGREELAFRLLTDFRKSLGTLSVEPLVEIFESHSMGQLKKAWQIPDSSGEFHSYIAKSVELIWMMKIQHPPMELEWKYINEDCDKNRYTFYTKRGDKVKQTVWPAVLLHKDGPLVAKGVVQAL